MIYEYAIEPEAVVGWASNILACRYIKDNFGIGKPRMMIEFPNKKKYRKHFRRAAASLNENDKMRLVELFSLLTENSVSRTGVEEYDGNVSWIENVEKENKRHFFKAILAENNPRNIKNFLLSDQIGEWPKDLWEVQTSTAMTRETGIMRKTFSPLLQKANEILFIDPYFRATRIDFRESFEAFLQESIKCKVYPVKQRIELQVSGDYYKCKSAAEFERECEDKLPEIIPRNLKVVIKRLKQRFGREKIHNRYILTNLGGVFLGTGLDTGEKGQSDDISLLGCEQYNLRWQQYANENGEFELESKFTVDGQKNV
jgi:hypothetical protein